MLTAGAQFRLPPPPSQAATAAEIGELKGLAAQRDAMARDLVQFWDTGAPGYRWNAILRDEILSHGTVNSSATTARHFSPLNVAIYDATIAAWDSKYAYNRARPSEADPTFNALLPTPASPSYPSEHAAVAAAASGVLAYLFPDVAAALVARADEAIQSRLVAGVQYPSDTAAGSEVGQKVAELMIERARHDGSEVP